MKLTTLRYMLSSQRGLNFVGKTFLTTSRISTLKEGRRFANYLLYTTIDATKIRNESMALDES